MTEHDMALMRSLADREAIRDCLYRYCRGIDRLDEAALRSAYWPDGTDRHGPYDGSAAGFIDWALEKLKTSGRMIHRITNILIDLQGDVAWVESYFEAIQGERDRQGQAIETLLCGRYLDKFERRGTEWRIGARTVVYDWMRQTPLPHEMTAEVFGVRQPTGSHQSTDPLYPFLNQRHSAG